MSLNRFAVFVHMRTNTSYDQNGLGEMLCVATDGYFASKAWIIGDEAFNKITGRSFGFLAGDDCLPYKEDKASFRRATNEDLKIMLPKCGPQFVELALEILNLTSNEDEQILQLLKSDWPRASR